MKIVPIVLCRNEEYWIEKILAPLSAVFGNVVMGDTGSTDETFAIAGRVPGVSRCAFGVLGPHELGQARGEIQKFAKDNFYATHVLLVDGDELYTTRYLQYIKDNPMPEDAPGGFTYGIEATELDNGECWLYDLGLNRHAIFSVDSKWKGSYPFESPDSYLPGDPKNFYWQSPGPGYNFYHLHHMSRSSKDSDVYMRVEKRHQFSLQDHPEIKPAKFWLTSREDYCDEQ